MAKEEWGRAFSRGEFLRVVAGLGGLALATPLIQACQRLGMIEPTATSTATDTPTPLPTATRAPTMTSSPVPTQTSTPTATSTPTSTPAPTSTPTATPTATATATSAPTVAPTITLGPTPTPAPGATMVALVRTEDRADGVRRAIELLGINPAAGKQVLVKPNFNSPDPAPASTHPNVLRTAIVKLREMGAGQITVGDRSGQGSARSVMKAIDGFAMADELGFDFVDFDQLGMEDWVLIDPPDSHWRSKDAPLGPGFPFARPVLDAEAVVSLCCLKTHYAGLYTMSLKNSVGMVANVLPMDTGSTLFSYMYQVLHEGNIQAKIAEINVAYEPALIVLDGVLAFNRGGPATGHVVRPRAVLAGTDRVAIDAVAIAILSMFGTNVSQISKVIQIRRAIELGLGMDHPGKIHFLTDDEPSARFAQRVRGRLMDRWA